METINVALDNGALDALETPLLAAACFQPDEGQGGSADADDTVEVAVFGDALGLLNEKSGGRLAALAREEGLSGESGKTLLVHTPELAAKRVLLVGMGKRSELAAVHLRKLSASAVEEAQGRHLPSAAVALVSGIDVAEAVRHTAEGVVLGAYRYTGWLTDKKETRRWVESVHLAVPGSDLAPLQPVVERAHAAASAVNLARDLVNGPPTEVTPRRLAAVAEQIAEDESLECIVYDEERIKAEKMNLLMAVGVGSSEPPRLIHLTYRPPDATEETPQVALLGKGITYDAGGYNIKPTGSLEDMKIDMSGAAAVLGAMKAIRRVAPKVVVHGIVASAENLVSASAYKPGDIIRSHNGKTVEIMNTDAEGRLVLADALSYAEKLGCKKMVDLATLTGACMVALGPFTAGLFANDDGWRKAIEEAAERAGEDIWAMPLSKKLRAMLKSPIADMKNVGERWGGAITAALFLKEFIGETTWAHLDIAGPASNDKPEPGAPRGATGFGVMTLLELVANEA